MILKCTRGLLTSNTPNQKYKFLDFLDSEHLFNESVRKLKYWEYKNIDIEYSYNNYGHRCENVENLISDYILFAGCSITEGIGLKLEHTYANIVATTLGMKYYNLSCPGTGPEIVAHNITLFLSMVERKPKYIVIQWPDFNRYFSIDGDYNPAHYNPNKLTDFYLAALKDGLPRRKNIFYRTILLEFINNLGLNNVIELSSDYSAEYMETNLKTTVVKNIVEDKTLPFSKARNLAHPGMMHNKLQAEELIREIKNLDASINM